MITEADVLTVLSRHIGADRGITCAQLVRAITHQVEIDGADERRVRRLIQALRERGEHICGHPKTGYFIAADLADLDSTCLFLYERAMTSLKQVAAMKRVSLPDLAGQLRLPS